MGKEPLTVFHVNYPLILLYIFSALFGFISGFFKRNLLHFFFQIIGSFYALLALLGFIYVEKEILGIFASSPANTWIHVILAVGALILGLEDRKGYYE